MNDAPPAYSPKGAPSSSSTADPPPYAPPRTYTVGTHTLAAPLVQPRELRAHLALLRAFAGLRATVARGAFEFAFWPALVDELDAAQRWAWVVGLAVDRCVSLLCERLGAERVQVPRVDAGRAGVWARRAAAAGRADGVARVHAEPDVSGTPGEGW